MIADKLVQTMASSTSRVTFNTFVTIYTPRTSEFLFVSNGESIFGKMLNYQITLANRLSKTLSGGQENPVLGIFILDETIKCWFKKNVLSVNFFFNVKNGFLWLFIFYFRSAFRMVEFQKSGWGGGGLTGYP